MFPRRVIAGMICFSAFFGVAIGLGTWLPNIMTAKGFTITKSLTYTFGMTLAVPCASLFMMYALDQVTAGRSRRSAPSSAPAHGDRVRQRRQRHAIAGRRLHHDLLHPGGRQLDADLRVGGVPDQRAGLGLRLGRGCRPSGDRRIVPAILWIQTGYGLTTVFVCLAIVLLIAAASVTQLGPEAKQKGLDEIAPPTG